MLLREAAQKFKWNLNYGQIALMWRGGCIIRSVFLGKIKDAFTKNPQLSNLLLDDFFMNEIAKCQDSWRHLLSNAVLHGIPTPAFSTALAFYDGYRSAQLPANLIQVKIVKIRSCCINLMNIIFYRHKEIISVHILTNWLINLANGYIPIGQVKEETYLHRHTMHKNAFSKCLFLLLKIVKDYLEKKIRNVLNFPN